MPDDWKDKLRQAGRDRQRIRPGELLQEGRYQEALEELGKPTNPDDEKLAATCHYWLLKHACAEGNLAEGKKQARLLLQLRAGNRALRTLAEKRLVLLNKPAPGDISQIPVEPGIAHVAHDLKVAVLGRYVVWGPSTTLNQLIELLKKAPEEMSAAEVGYRPRLITQAGRQLADLLMEMDYLAEVDLIIPLPADPERAATRAYSQQEEIAKALSAFTRIPEYSNDILRKVRPTRSLRTLDSSQERAQELAGSMSVPEDKEYLLKDNTVLLVDDIVTYGTHIREATKVLTEAGAKQVFACALATAHENLIPLDPGQ